MNAEKLNKLSSKVRIGGKGTVRRKRKVVHRTPVTIEKNVHISLKELSLNQISEIGEAFMIYSDGRIKYFNNPKVEASSVANIFVITGYAMAKRFTETDSEILSQLSDEIQSF
jgi:nascent polypeptide-associated complex subunit beta